MDIRELKSKDIKTIAKMLGKLKSTSVGDLFVALDSKKTDPLKVGISIFRVIAADLTDDIYAWLADMAGVSVEELDEMPAATPIDIVKKIIERGDFADFLGLATLQKTAGSTTLSKKDTAGPTEK